MRFNYYKKAVILTMVNLILFLIINLILKYFVPLDRLQQVLTILNQDTQLLWIQKTNLNTMFFGSQIETNNLGLRTDKILPKKDNEYRILVLGASPSFGWGIENKNIYSSKLQKLLEEKYPQQKINVINASVIGYSSWQGLRLLKKYNKVFAPDMMVVSYVINDVSMNRFFQSSILKDNQLVEQSSTLLSIRNYLSDFHLYQLVNSLIKITFTNDLIDKKELKTSQKNKSRVSNNDYKENLKEFIQIANNLKSKLIFLKFPVSFPILEKPSGQQKEAIAISSRSKVYNKIMQIVSVENKVNIVDIARKFSLEQQYLFIDKKYDPIHPNKLGHSIIARELYNFIEDKQLITDNKYK